MESQETPSESSGLTHLPIVDEAGRLSSDLWLDQPDAHERIEAEKGVRDLTSAERSALQGYVEDGFVSFRIDLSDELVRRLESDIDRFWRDRPPDLAYTYIEQPRSMSDAIERRARRPTYRLLDIHSHSDAARSLYLNPQIFRWASLILDSEPVAFRSVFGEFGSRQPLVRDAVNVDCPSVSHLLTAWIALEDVEGDSAPPRLIPGSHRLPFHEFGPGRISIREGEDYLPAYRDLITGIRKSGLQERIFTCPRGTVLLRHPALAHGAHPVRNPRTTRRMLEINLSSRIHCPKRGGSFVKKVRGSLGRREDRLFWSETDRLLDNEGCVGLDNPLRGLSPRSSTLRERIAGRLGGR